MYEVEVKVRADHGAVRDRLAALEAEPLGTVEQVDTYYDAPHRSFAETDEALRVRAETPVDAGAGADPEGPPTEGADRGTVHELTYKGPKVDADSKTRAEHETTIRDPDATDAALRAMGFEPAATVEKVRERHRLAGYTVTLDEVSGLGSFVEVEREGAEHEIDELRAGAFEVLADLGLDPDDQIRTSYLSLVLSAPGDNQE